MLGEVFCSRMCTGFLQNIDKKMAGTHPENIQNISRTQAEKHQWDISESSFLINFSNALNYAESRHSSKFKQSFALKMFLTWEHRVSFSQVLQDYFEFLLTFF